MKPIRCTELPLIVAPAATCVATPTWRTWIIYGAYLDHPVSRMDANLVFSPIHCDRAHPEGTWQ